MLTLPIFQNTSADFEYQITIEEVILTIRMNWNIRTNAWNINFTTDDYTIGDLKLVVNYPLLRQHKALFPELGGDFLVIKDNDSAGTDITYTNLGTDYLLKYYTAEEVEEWNTTNGIR